MGITIGFTGAKATHTIQRRANKKDDMLKVVRDVSSLVDIHYIRQKEPRGLGDAVLRAEKHINGEPFAVLLGDKPVQVDVRGMFDGEKAK